MGLSCSRDLQHPNYISNLTRKEKIQEYYTFTNKVLNQKSNSKLWIAEDKRGNLFVIKTIIKGRTKSITQLKNEIEISLSLSNPNIMKYKEVFETVDKVYIVMEYLCTQDLWDYILNSKTNKISEYQAMEIFYQILQALRYLHVKKEVIHRDIKPENFIVCKAKKGTVVKWIDFGLSIPSCEASTASRVGTRIYLPPEYFIDYMKGSTISYKGDMWSAGWTLLNMIIGAHPFSEVDSRQSLDEQIKYKQIEFNVIKNEDIRSWCKRLLERDPHERIDVEDALKATKHILRNVKEETYETTNIISNYDDGFNREIWM